MMRWSNWKGKLPLQKLQWQGFLLRNCIIFYRVMISRLDINNPKEPKIICMGNNPQKIQIYGAVLSLYISRLVKIVNKKGKQKSSFNF